MTDIARLTAANLARWKACQVHTDWLVLINKVAIRLVASKSRYQSVESFTHVPWSIIAVIHEREASQSWQASLAQGDPWNRVSIHVPRGRGPFQTWEGAAIDALEHCPPFLARWEDWSIGGALTALEQYNGLGYAAKGLPSPYIWAATDQYHAGKYIADGHFDPHAVDHQLGCAAILMRMSAIDDTIAKDWHP